MGSYFLKKNAVQLRVFTIIWLIPQGKPAYHYINCSGSNKAPISPKRILKADLSYLPNCTEPYNKSFCSLVLVLCHLHKPRIQHHYETFLQRSPIMMHFKNCCITVGLADNSTAWIIRRCLGIFPRSNWHRWIRDIQEWVFAL